MGCSSHQQQCTTGHLEASLTFGNCLTYSVHRANSALPSVPKALNYQTLGFTASTAMSLPAGRVLRRAVQRNPAAGIFGVLPAAGPTPPSRLRIRDAVPAVTAGFHTATAARRHETSKAGKGPTDEEIASVAGSYARTDDSITVEYPPDEQLPTSKPVAGAGRAGANVFPTLATFSLQGKVGVVTGGARGLGLVMGRKSLLHLKRNRRLIVCVLRGDGHQRRRSSHCRPQQYVPPFSLPLRRPVGR